MNEHEPPGGQDLPRGPELPGGLLAALRRFAARPRVLVALDFDGVLAPIVDDPEASRPLPESAAALARLVAAPQVVLALVSGRTLADLRRLASPPEQAVLVGSHGAQVAHPGEAGPDDARLLDEPARQLLGRVVAALERISSEHPGTAVEVKPVGAVLHTRRADRRVAQRAAEQAMAGPAAWPGVHVTLGKEVVDLAVLDVTKGGALQRLRSAAGLPAGGGGVLYVGDDVTDERAFAVLDDAAGDVTVKVGEGPSVARHRVDAPARVAVMLDVLGRLLEGPAGGTPPPVPGG